MTLCVAVCCSVLQCVAVCCSVLQCVAVCCSVNMHYISCVVGPGARKNENLQLSNLFHFVFEKDLFMKSMMNHMLCIFCTGA